MAKFGKRPSAFFKRRWREEALKHRWRAIRAVLPRWHENFRFPISLRAFIFSLKIPPQERIAQLRAYAEKLKRLYPVIPQD
ncbi:MAG: hypothetical protein ACUVTP_12415 [Candidatus Fervidibacter sp.]|uniref:hypothetical protein n=1 Tax=Candidatus Fervidibacter sp. TaxID=3100871 RepID=UPI00404B855D